VSRPVSIKNEAILGAARKVFLQHGYQAGTKKVAREAGVSEGSLFKHFKTKADLFMAAMETDAGILSWEEKLMKSVGKGDVRKNLESAGMQILEHLEVMLPCVMMVRSSGITIAQPHRQDGSRVPHPIQRMYALANYFRAESKAGRLVIKNPEVQAQILFGTMAHYVFNKIVCDFRLVSPVVYVRTVVDMILHSSTPAQVKKDKR